jgi:hypothetical protein
LKNKKRSKLEQICEVAIQEQKQMVAINHELTSKCYQYFGQILSLNQELDRTRKRHLEQILSLATENDFEKAIAERQRTEGNTSIKKLQAPSQNKETEGRHRKHEEQRE